jgi:hypothetical protein
MIGSLVVVVAAIIGGRAITRDHGAKFRAAPGFHELCDNGDTKNLTTETQRRRDHI